MNLADTTDREKVLFEQALDLASGPERLAFLKGACGDDLALAARVQALLQAHEASEGFLPGRPADRTALLPVSEKPGDWVGRYKLREKIGEGGCGVVYVAEQEEPVRRRVALKVIKLGMDTKQVVARFEAERQALAMMDHPNIARVLDAGATETGRPYFVMELVRGIKITDYCDQNNLSTRARLDLFIQICRAVQHAHQKGIIHRDLKPSNILVTLHDGMPVPKVIDFGIAKATEGRLSDLTVYTELNQFIGTPTYMSPEQAEMSGLDIDTRSDIYSLGVLLYELLTGQTPFAADELMRLGLDEMPDDSGEGAAAALDPAGHDGGRGVDHHGQASRLRSPKAYPSGARRPGLDRDEVSGEGSHASVRDGQWIGDGPSSVTSTMSRWWRVRPARRIGFRNWSAGTNWLSAQRRRSCWLWCWAQARAHGKRCGRRVCAFWPRRHRRRQEPKPSRPYEPRRTQSKSAKRKPNFDARPKLRHTHWT
jgi:serine/threonine protein kinase